MPSILPPISLPLLIHTRPIPCPLPVRPQPTLLQPPAHSSFAPILFPFCPQPTLRPSPAHSPLSVTPRTCTSVTLSPLAYNLFTRLPINSSTCPLLPELVHLLPCLLIHLTCSLFHSLTRLLPPSPVSSRIQLVHPSPRQLVNLQCYSSNLFICYPVSSRIQLVHSSPRQLANLQCYSPNLFTCYHVY